MRLLGKKNGRRGEQGVALVIAIFTLMLISVVATALILTAGTQSAIKSNYKSSMHAFYDAKAGLEEARGRLWAYNPNSITNCVFPTPGAPMPLQQVCYIVNPSDGEVVNPADSSNAYADVEYANEWDRPVAGVSGADSPLISKSKLASPDISGPLYKWVRITPTTEYSAHVDVDGLNGLDKLNPLFYDGSQQLLGNGSNPPVPNAAQVLTITALSVTPQGSRRMVQYTVAQSLAGALNLNLNVAPMMILGENPVYNPPRTRSFQVNGNDRSGANAGSCALPPQPATTAVGLTDDPTSIVNAISLIHRQSYYQVSGVPSPSVTNVSSGLLPGEQSVQTLDSLVQSLASSATVVINGPGTKLPTYGSASQPIIAVVLPSTQDGTDGDLSLNNVTGYGILVVSGRLTLSGNFGWRGIILVIGQGQVTGSAVSGNEIDGAMIVAQTRDASGHLLPSSLGNATVTWTNGRGSFFYDSCWINNAMAAFPYKVLSFREIPQLQ